MNSPATTPSQSSPEIRAALRASLDSLRDFEEALRGVNDPELLDNFSEPLSVTRKILGDHSEQITPTLADDIANIRSQVARYVIERDGAANSRDGDSSYLDRGSAATALRRARGALLADLQEVLEASAKAGLRVTEFPLPQSVEFHAANMSTLFGLLEKRLSDVERSLHNLLETEESSTKGSSQQNILVDFFLSRMRTQISLTRSEIHNTVSIDYASLTRAVENISELTLDFVQTLRGMPQKIGRAIRESAERILPKVEKLVRGAKAIVFKTRRFFPAEKDEDQPEDDNNQTFDDIISLGNRNFDQRKYEAARRNYRLALEIAKSHRHRSIAYEKVGKASFAQHQSRESRSYFEKSLAHLEELETLNPLELDIQISLATIHNRLGEAFLSEDRLTLARAHLEKSLSVMVQIMALGSRGFHLKPDLSSSSDNPKDRKIESRSAEYIKRQLQAAVSITKRYPSSSSRDNVAWQRKMALSAITDAQLAEARGNATRALARFADAIQVMQSAWQRRPSDKEIKQDLTLLEAEFTRLKQA